MSTSWCTSSPASYVGPAREVRFRVKGNNRTSTYTSRGDFMAFDYDYTSGTLLADRGREPMSVVAEPAMAYASYAEAAYANAHLLAGAPGSMATHLDREAALRETPQAVLERIEAAPAQGGAELEWAVNAGDHVDGFNVYREADHGALVFAGNDAVIALDGGDAVFRFTDPSGAASGVYWLGVRSCSGTEGLVGPIRVEASASQARLDLSVAPNPAAGATTFEFALAREADVMLEVFDLEGRKIATPLAGRFVAGSVRASWNLHDHSGAAVEPGTYFARLQTLGRTLFSRVTVVAR